MGVKGRLWLLLYNWYQDIVANVVLIYDKMSRDIPIKQSVKQGSILGPWLYMLYIHDIAVHLLDPKVGARIGSLSFGSLLQADDIALAYLTVNGLQ